MRNEIIDSANKARLLKHLPQKGRPVYQVVWLEGGTFCQGRIVSRLRNARANLKRAAVRSY